MKISRRETPALYQMLIETTPGSLPGCSECPFATDPREVNLGDPDEGYYACKLLGQDVWGEDPQCLDSHWQGEALKELARDTSDGGTAR